MSKQQCLTNSTLISISSKMPLTWSQLQRQNLHLNKDTQNEVENCQGLMEKMDISHKAEMQKEKKDSKCAQISSSCVLDMASEKKKGETAFFFWEQQLHADPKKAGKFQSFDLSPITTSANAKEVLQCL